MGDTTRQKNMDDALGLSLDVVVVLLLGASVLELQDVGQGQANTGHSAHGEKVSPTEGWRTDRARTDRASGGQG
jgi:hypothetical protein